MEDAASSRPPQSRRRVSILMFVLIAAAPLAASASGHLPGFPIPPRHFPDYAACKAFLDQTARDDRAQAEAQPRETEPGTTRQTLVVGDGVVERGREQAEYRVQIGAQFRRRDPERAAIVTTFSYDERSFRCDGGALSGESGARGYYLPGYEPLPATTP